MDSVCLLLHQGGRIPTALCLKPSWSSGERDKARRHQESGRCCESLHGVGDMEEVELRKARTFFILILIAEQVCMVELKLYNFITCYFHLVLVISVFSM